NAKGPNGRRIMEHIAAIMLLVACSDDLGACREVSVDVAHFATVEDCEKQLEPSLVRVIQSAPQAFGQCVSMDPADENRDVQLGWEIGRDGEFRTQLKYTDVVIASAMDNKADNRDA